jgi:anti-sigma factor RsiW
MRLSYRVRFARDHRWAPARMSEYVDDELAPPARQRMERHARECPECERVLAGLQALVRGLGRLPAPSGELHAAQLASVVRARLDELPAP